MTKKYAEWIFLRDRLQNIQEYANKCLESHDVKKHSVIEPPVNGCWRKLSDRKWEFRYNDLVLATIFCKPDNQYSLFIKPPNFYKKIHMIAADTHVFSSFDEAKNGFTKMLKESFEWCSAVLMYLREIPPACSN